MPRTSLWGVRGIQNSSLSHLSWLLLMGRSCGSPSGWASHPHQGSAQPPCRGNWLWSLLSAVIVLSVTPQSSRAQVRVTSKWRALPLDAALSAPRWSTTQTDHLIAAGALIRLSASCSIFPITCEQDSLLPWSRWTSPWCNFFCLLDSSGAASFAYNWSTAVENPQANIDQ